MRHNKLIEFVEQEYIDNFIRGCLMPASTGNSMSLMASLSRNFLQSSTSALSAICALGKLEFSDEPLILARTIFEYSVHHAYIHAGGDARAKAFVGKGYEEQKRRRSELSELKKQNKCHEVVEAIDAAISQEKFPDIEKDWEELPSLKKMAENLGAPYECDWYFIYWSLSKAAHPNDINTIPRNPADDAKRALLFGFNYHYRIAQKVCENLEHELNAKAQEFLRLVNDERARMMVMQPYKGSCHCGAIKFSFEAESIIKGVRCNCSYCAKRGTMISLVPGERFKVEAEAGALGTYQWGRMQAKHHFCKHCGISTFSETARRPGQYIVNLGCVEGVDTFALEVTVFDGKHLL